MDFSSLSGLPRIWQDPIKRHAVQRPSPEDFAAELSKIYASGEAAFEHDSQSIEENIPPVTYAEVDAAISTMHRNRCASAWGRTRNV